MCHMLHNDPTIPDLLLDAIVLDEVGLPDCGRSRKTWSIHQTVGSWLVLIFDCVLFAAPTSKKLSRACV